MDWGVAELYSKKDEEFLVRVEALVDKYRPAIIALEDCAGTRRGERAVRRIALAADYAGSRKIGAVLVSRDDVRRTLGLSTKATKHAVAAAITEAYPELGFVLPSPRKPWQTEDERMRVFGAVARAVTGCPLSQQSVRDEIT